MPFDANGNFSLVPGTIVSDGMTIQPSQHNPPLQDFAAGMSMVVVRDGRSPMTGPLNMNGNKISNVGSGDQPGDVITRADISDMAVDIGDGAWSIRDLAPNWLRRNGGLYLRADYPDLAALLPPLPDGILWTSLPGIPSVTGGNPNDLSYGNGLFVAGGNSGYVYLSTDLTSWSYDQIETASGATWYKSAYGANIFVLCGNGGRLATSPDGGSWAVQTVAAGVTFFDIIWTGTRFLAVGENGSSPIIYQSPSGAPGSWSSISVSGTGGLRAITRVGNNLVVVGGNGGVRTSSDGGDTWTSRTSGVSVTLFDVFMNGTDVIAVGSAGTIIASANSGETWTTRVSSTLVPINRVVHSDAGWLAGGGSGNALISTTGASWSSAPTGISNSINGLVVDPTNLDNGYIVLAGRLVLRGIRTLPTQFQVPNDDPTYGWIRAL